ncbi:MFS transporter [Rheinheimera texasensis]|uniref:MFS transporter n=1 Tax=Rheinheimera texasensis TaxID=306205 RepID=UPI0004E27A1D|nr:MFS transporter [Rheinheimera texasensis]
MSRFHPTAMIFGGFFLLGILIILWGILLPDLSRELQLEPAQSGWFFMTMALGTISGAFIGGKYVQKFEFLRLFAVLALTETVILLGISLLQQRWQLFAGIFLFGLLASVMFTIGHTLIARLHANKRAKMMGLMDFMFSLGTLAAPFMVVVLYWWQDDWRWPVRLMALSLVGLAGYAFWLSRQQLELAGYSDTVRRSLSYRAVLKKPVFWALAFAMFGYGAVEWGNGNWFVSYASAALPFDTEQARLIFAFFTGGMVISRLGFAWFIPLLGSKKLLRILILLMFSGALLVKVMDSATGLALGNLLLGLGLGGVYPLLLSTAMDLDADNGPVLSGLSNIASSLGCQLAGLGTGLWAQHAGIGQAFWMLPLLAVWLFASVWWFSRLAIKAAG